MKKILFITLLLLILLTITACNNISNIPRTTEAIALTPIESGRTFRRSVDELINWIETADAEYMDYDMKDFLELIRQRDSIITIDEISGEFALSSVTVYAEGEAVHYHFDNGHDRIFIRIFLTQFGEINQPLGEAVADLAERNFSGASVQIEQLESVQYISLIEDVQNVSIERMALEITNLYYFHGATGTRVFFEIDGIHISVSFQIRNPESPLYSVNTTWDNSYLDMFQFISRPIRVGGRPMEPITPPIGVPDVTLNGVSIEFDVDPIIVNDRTMVPFRAIFEALEMEVEWNSHAGIATGMRRGLRIEIPIGHDIAFVNGDEVDLDVPAMIYNDRTMVPLRFVAEATGANVEWDEDTQTVLISTN